MRSFLSLLFILIFFSACKSQLDKKFELGSQQFNEYLPLLKDKKVGLVVNQTSTIGSTHLVDTLLSLGINVKTIFAPEHGFRGSAGAGEHIENGTDSKTGLPIISLYGNHRKPTVEDFDGLDAIVFDIQDVGVRFYTYISTMHYVMEACAEQHKKCIVLDRPNPNGQYIAGPVLDTAYQSFVGMHPIPIVHGLTIGELAQMINGEKWLKNGEVCDLNVVKMTGYSHKMNYSLPINPSPNLPNDRSIALYPSLCLLEPTVISVGRGTNFPFQVTGYPDSTYGSFTFTPKSNKGAPYPKHEGEACFGEDLRTKPSQTRFTLKWLIYYYNKHHEKGFFTSPGFFDKLAGNNILRNQIAEGKSEEEIKRSWLPELNKYKVLRKKYLLYPDE